MFWKSLTCDVLEMPELFEKGIDAFDENGEFKMFYSPLVGDSAYRHRLYRPHATMDILRGSNDCNIPPDLLKMYKHFNGCYLFHGSIHFYGVYNPDTSSQPFTLFTLNGPEAPKGLRSEHTAFMVIPTSYSSNGVVYYDSKHKKVYLCMSSSSIEPIKEWDSPEESLVHMASIFKKYITDDFDQILSADYKAILEEIIE